MCIEADWEMRVGRSAEWGAVAVSETWIRVKGNRGTAKLYATGALVQRVCGGLTLSMLA